jgi:multidrug resistance efflux pump
MSMPFVRTLRYLDGEGAAASVAWTLLAGVLIVGWAAWFGCARVGVIVVSEGARVESTQQVHELRARTDGSVESMSARLGQRVERGEVLLELATDETRLLLAEAQARHDTLARQRGPLRERIAAEALTEGEATERLHDAEGRAGEALAGVHRELAERQLAAAERLADALTKAELVRLQTKLGELEGELAEAELRIHRLQSLIEQAKVRAPIAGTIGWIEPLTIGEVVERGRPLLTIIPSGELHVVADFAPEQALGRIEPGQPATLRLHGFPWLEYGTVDAIVEDIASEAKDGAVRVELRVVTESTSPISLSHGLLGEVEVETELASPWALVLRALGRGGHEPDRGTSP